MSASESAPRGGATGGPILIGTSGYSFRDWVGPFYPAGTPSSEFLSYYTRHFNVVEVNSSYYGIPKPRVMHLMERKTPPGFRFVVKLHQSMTHEATRNPATYREFADALEPLKLAGKFDGLLAQFPGGFRRNEANLAHLEALRELLPRDPLYVEFRNESWLTPELEPWLAERELGYVAVDEPQLPGLLPPVTMSTNGDVYVRFHGRNEKNWYGGGGDRYDYNYSETELRDWMEKVRELADRARRTYLFFNNCHAGQAARNAKLMHELLRMQQANVEMPRGKAPPGLFHEESA